MSDHEKLFTRLFENSPSPDTSEPEDKDNPPLWQYEIVGEEVTGKGEVRYEVDWDDWQREDGTTQTWHRLPPSALKNWNSIQERRRKTLLQDSIDIELDMFAGTDIHNFETCLRAQAYQEKLKERNKYRPETLEDEMLNLLAEKLDPEWNLGARSSSSDDPSISVGQSRRRLRQSTMRQQQTSGLANTPKRLPSTSRDGASTKPPSTSRLNTSTLASASALPPPQANPSISRPALPTQQSLQPRSITSQNPPAPTDPPNSLARKRKLSEVENTTSEPGLLPSRQDNGVSMAVDKGKAPMHKLRPRLTLTNEWTKIAQATGASPITFVNEEDGEEVPPLVDDFQYLEKGYIYPPGIDKPSRDFQVGCSCRQCDLPSNCECQDDSEVVNKNEHKAFAYTKAGLFSFRPSRGTEVLECNAACTCNTSCFNRVAQRPRDVPLQIFKTRGKGWGVRATVDIVRGKVIGMYSGKLITRKEALNLEVDEAGYIFDLDGQESLDSNDNGELENKFSVDSRTCGNWTHFVNHSCGPNMVIYLVVHDTIPSTNQPYVTFVAREHIKAGTELTVDYDPYYADDSTGQYSEGRKKCSCGSDKCRDWVRMS